MVDIPGVENINWGGGLSQIGYWGGIILLSLVFFGILIAAYFLMQYKYKVVIMQRRGIGLPGYTGKKDDEHSVGKIIKDRAKFYKDKNGVTKFRLLRLRKTPEPPKYENIYPGNNIFMYQIADGSFVPVNFTCSNPSASFSPLPQHIRYWEQLEIRQTAEDYQKKGVWEQYGQVIVMAGTVLFCLILVGVTIYFSYKHANGVTSALSGLTSTLKDFGTAQAIGPH